MILLDVNVLVAAWNQDDPNHATVRTWLESKLLGREPICIPWLVRHAFIRITTNPRLFSNPLRLEEAFEIVETWAGSTAMFEAEPGPLHFSLLQEVAIQTQSSGSKLTDCVLAAIAAEHGADLASLDRDFGRFKTIKWIDLTNSHGG